MDKIIEIESNVEHYILPTRELLSNESKTFVDYIEIK